MKFILTRVTASLSLICVVFLEFCLLTSCIYPCKHRFDQIKEEICCIEIVEARSNFDYNIAKFSPSQIVLYEIDNIGEFLNELDKIPHFDMVGDPNGFSDYSIGVKITYNNGEYEIFNSYSKASFSLDKGYSVYADSGSFDTKAFYSILFNYLERSNSPTFSFIHHKSDVSSIEIVQANNPHSALGEFTVLSKIEDHSKFFNDLESLNYQYTNDQLLSSKPDFYWKNDGKAIRINYCNGDYEIFSCDLKEVGIKTNDSYNRTIGAYIGTFDEKAFYNLLSQYCE